MAENKYIDELASLTSATIDGEDLIPVEDASVHVTKSLKYKYIRPGMVDVRTYGAIGDGVTDDTVSLQAALDALTNGGTLWVPKTSSYYVITSALDVDVAHNVTIEAENGAEIRLSTAAVNGINITKNHVTVRGLTMEGQGTFDDTSSPPTGGALIKSTGDYTRIEGCYLKEGHQTNLRIQGDYSCVTGNTFEGGPYYASNAAWVTAGSPTEYYGVLYMAGADFGTFTDNTCKPNADATPGKPLQCICTQQVYDMSISNNRFLGAWDHSVYGYLEGSTVSGNVIESSGGIKIVQRAYGTALRGNVVKGNAISGDSSGPTAPMYGDAGIILNNPFNSLISGNTISNVQDSGILISSSTTPWGVYYNTISDNVINTVKPGGGSHAVGIDIDDGQLRAFSYNTISDNIIVNISDVSTGNNSGIFISGPDVEVPAIVPVHVGNKISGNTIYNSYEYAMYLQYLTVSEITGNIIRGVHTGGSDAAIVLNYVSYSRLSENLVTAVAVELDCAIKDAGSATSTYNIVEKNCFQGCVTAPVLGTGWSSTSIVRNNDLMTGGLSDYSTAGARTITAANLAIPVHIRDPNGAAVVDTTDTAANIIALLLPYDGATHEVLYYNGGGGSETITLLGGTNVYLYNSEGADDCVITAGAGARLLFMRYNSGAVRLFVTVFERDA